MPALRRGWTSLRSISSVEYVFLAFGLRSTPGRIESGVSSFDWSRSASVLVLLELSAITVASFPPSTRCRGLLLVWLLSLEARTALHFPVKAEPPCGGEGGLPTERGKPVANDPGLRLRLSGLVPNPFESSCGDKADNQEVVAAKTGRVLPGVTFLVCSLKSDIEHLPFLRLLAPDACAHGAVADCVDGLSFRFTNRRFIFLCLIFHDVILLLLLMLMNRSVGAACSSRRRPAGTCKFSKCCQS